jgi:hypothetical protein
MTELRKFVIVDRDFLADNIGQSFVGVVAQALDDNYRRYNH